MKQAIRHLHLADAVPAPAQEARYLDRFDAAAETCPRQPEIAYRVRHDGRRPWRIFRRALLALRRAGAARERVLAIVDELRREVESWYEPRVLPLEVAMRRQVERNGAETVSIVDAALSRCPGALARLIDAAEADIADDQRLIESAHAALLRDDGRIPA